jgi:hypothetical protein
MLEPHKRAALIPNNPGVAWHEFLSDRFIESSPFAGKRLAIVVHTIQQQSYEHAELRGLLEISSGSSLPVVSGFAGSLNLESREILLQQVNPDRHFTGQISENGRVITLREKEQSKPMHLIHEGTFAQLV